MWMIFRNVERPAARDWPGRRAFALLDAVVWPALFLAGLWSLHVKTGVVGWVMTWVLLTALVRRAQRAWFENARYWFTTWRYGIPLATLVSLSGLVRVMHWLGN